MQQQYDDEQRHDEGAASGCVESKATTRHYRAALRISTAPTAAAAAAAVVVMMMSMAMALLVTERSPQAGVLIASSCRWHNHDASCFTTSCCDHELAQPNAGLFCGSRSLSATAASGAAESSGAVIWPSQRLLLGVALSWPLLVLSADAADAAAGSRTSTGGGHGAEVFARGGHDGGGSVRAGHGGEEKQRQDHLLSRSSTSSSFPRDTGSSKSKGLVSKATTVLLRAARHNYNLWHPFYYSRTTSSSAVAGRQRESSTAEAIRDSGFAALVLVDMKEPPLIAREARDERRRVKEQHGTGSGRSMKQQQEAVETAGDDHIQRSTKRMLSHFAGQNVQGLLAASARATLPHSLRLDQEIANEENANLGQEIPDLVSTTRQQQLAAGFKPRALPPPGGETSRQPSLASATFGGSTGTGGDVLPPGIRAPPPMKSSSALGNTFKGRPTTGPPPPPAAAPPTLPPSPRLSPPPPTPPPPRLPPSNNRPPPKLSNRPPPLSFRPQGSNLPPSSFTPPQSPTTDAAEFDVLQYGAAGDGVTNDTAALRAAFSAACFYANQQRRVVTIRFRYGYTFLTLPLQIDGPCGVGLTVILNGKIIAPLDPAVFPRPSNTDAWANLYFRSIPNLSITGGGSIDGRGYGGWWSMKGSGRPLALLVTRCDNFRITGVTLLNPGKQAFKMRVMSNVFISGITIRSGPEDSPNTDCVGFSDVSNAVMRDSYVECGDDNVAIVGRSSNILVTNIYASLGHGLSIGSLGERGSTGCVSNVVFRNITLVNTDNGARIKTYQGGYGLVRNVVFEDIRMVNVEHPIVIDQFYCDVSEELCGEQHTNVVVKDVVFRRISGTGDGVDLLELLCSSSTPCTNVTLSSISIRPKIAGKTLRRTIWNAFGTVSNVGQPAVTGLTLGSTSYAQVLAIADSTTGQCGDPGPWRIPPVPPFPPPAPKPPPRPPLPPSPPRPPRRPPRPPPLSPPPAVQMRAK